MPRSGWLAVGGALAALTLPAVPVGPGIAWVVAIAAAGVMVWVIAGRSRTWAIAVMVGALIVAVRLAIAPVDSATPVAPIAPDGRGPWLMIVESVGTPREGRQIATVRGDGGASGPLRLAASLPRYPMVTPGDLVTVSGRARERPDSPYGRYLERIGAWGTLQADTLEVVPAGDGPGRRLEQVRRAAGDALAMVLPEPEAGLAAGILIGLRDRVDRAVAADFTTAGVSHVVAISGWNIAIVAAAVGAMAGRMGRRRRAVVTAIAIAAYVAFAGMSPSVLRAGAMAGVVLLARESGRAGRAEAALGWAVLVLLAADPTMIGDAGFQLSTVATAGLIAWANGTTQRIDRLTGGRWPRWLVEILGISLAAQLATLPIVLATFGRIAIVAPLINLAVVPLVPPVMAAGVVALIGGALVTLGAPTLAGSALALPGWVGLRLMIALVDGAASLPYASLELDPPVGALLALALTSAIGAGIVARRRSGRAGPVSTSGPADGATRTRRPGPSTRHARLRRIGALTIAVALACSGAIAASRPPAAPRLTVLDVGQGDAILLEGSRGGRLLVDGGPDPDRLMVELDRRIPPWDRRIDVVVLTHPHEDHAAGLAMLLARYRVGRVMEPGMRGPGPGYAALAAALALPGAPSRGLLAAGDRLTVDEIRLDVRWPTRGTVPPEPPDDGTGINNVSIVLLGAVGERRFLLTGDVEEGVDPSLVAADLPRLDVLKVAHHGSRTATTAAFLAAVRPRVAIASAGAGNPYGHPTRATLDRLSAGGARVYRTDVDGTVTVLFEPAGPVVRREPRQGGTGRPASATVLAAATARTRASPPASRTFVCAIPGFADTDPAPAPDPTPAAPWPPGMGPLAAASPGNIAGVGSRCAIPTGPLGPGRMVGYHRRDDAA
ncbi:MAG: ComEC/Rec2 family competence protein [Chloroflexota bacterium]